MTAFLRLKASKLKAPLMSKSDNAGLLVFEGDGKGLYSSKWIDGLFICSLFCHSLWLGEVPDSCFGIERLATGMVLVRRVRRDRTVE